MTQRTVELDLGDAFHGEVISPVDAGYDEARAIFNAMIDKRPALIVRATGAGDVIDAINLARAQGLPLAVRSGGHSLAGKSVVEGGILVDLASLRGVHVDPRRRTARAGGGVLWGEFDRETSLFGLATPGGRVTTTGVGGFTLGGGYGWLSPKYGLTCDNLISADVVTADGRVVTASEDENADLFWALRGGGGNFGVVTSFEYRLHPIEPLLLGGLIVRPAESAEAVVRAWRDYMDTAPDELVSALAFIVAPPEPFIPENLHGKPVLGMVSLYIGHPDEGQRYIQPLKDLAPVAVDAVEPMPYTAFQALLDPFAPKGWQNYTHGVHLTGLPDEAVDAYVRVGRQIESPMSQGILFRHGGEVSRIPTGSTAFAHRDAAYMAHPIACWGDPAESERHIAWADRCERELSPFLTGGVYLNFEVTDDEATVRAGYGQEHYDRLVEIKDTWDPENVFSVNQNIRPSRARVPGQARREN